jgi:hypothetical protein
VACRRIFNRGLRGWARMRKKQNSYPRSSAPSAVETLLFPGNAEGLRTDDVLWRATRRADNRQD